MGLILSIFIILMQCTITPNLASAAGHTVNNSGGMGEILFTDVWENLAKILEPLADVPEVKTALERRASVPEVRFDARTANKFRIDSTQGVLVLSPSLVYGAGDIPLDRPAMVSLALTILLSCESPLTDIHPLELAREALTYRTYARFETPSGTVWKIWHRRIQLGDSLHMALPGEVIDLKQLFNRKLKTTDQILTFHDVAFRKRSDSALLSGFVMVGADTNRMYSFALAIRPNSNGSGVAQLDLTVY